MNLNKPWEIAKVTEAWCAVVHGVAELDMTWQLNSNKNILHFFMHFSSSNRGFPGGASSKELTYQCRRHWDVGSIAGLRRSPGGGHGNPLQYSCLENPLDSGAGGMGLQRVRNDWSDLAHMLASSNKHHLLPNYWNSCLTAPSSFSMTSSPYSLHRL